MHLLQCASLLIFVGVLSFLARTMFARSQVRFYSLMSLCYPPLLYHVLEISLRGILAFLADCVHVYTQTLLDERPQPSSTAVCVYLRRRRTMRLT